MDARNKHLFADALLELFDLLGLRLERARLLLIRQFFGDELATKCGNFLNQLGKHGAAARRFVRGGDSEVCCVGLAHGRRE